MGMMNKLQINSNSLTKSLDNNIYTGNQLFRDVLEFLLLFFDRFVAHHEWHWPLFTREHLQHEQQFGLLNLSLFVLL